MSRSRSSFEWPKEQLHRPEVLRPAIDERSLSASQRMGTIPCRVQAELAHPASDDPRILPR